MKRIPAASRRQHGAALMIIAALLVLGISWFAVSALSRTAVASYEREVITARALQMAKDALLSYAAHYAARTTHNFPGRMPCPESLTAIGTVNEGEATGACSNTLVEFGRLPWKTIGMEPLSDGDGERLWYVLSPNFHPVASPPATPLNFDTPAALPFDGTNVVALIIAPGKPLNTVNDSGTPPAPCLKVAQGAGRFDSPLNPLKFFECGNATGAYANLGQSPWTNDRAIAITQAEWADAIAPGVADRLQREVAPVLETWRATQSNANWGRTFMPYASSFSNPAANDFCGNSAAQGAASEGLPPLARAATSNCSWWQPASTTMAASVLGLLTFVNPAANCTAIAAGLECQFSGTTVLGVLGVAFTGVAPNGASSFRAPISWADVSFRRQSDNAPVTCTPVTALTQTLSPTTGDVSISGTCLLSGLLMVAMPLIMRISHLPDAAVIADLPAWYLGNQWEAHTYYSVSPGWTVNPGAAVCTAANRSGCITIASLDASTGNTDDKRFALALMGRRLSGQASGTNVLTDYLESRSSATLFTAAPANSTRNDRLAACPSLVSPGCI